MSPHPRRARDDGCGTSPVMLLGVFLSTQAVDAPQKVDRLLDLMVDALRPPREESPR
ncbi:hypothetical protein [Streptomyces tropicalis]|uniref:hypothetical protein n=1 Tax=Streptomyces tropicalis TaxID=3034234 RepID=UPI0028BD5C3C|nr:hypothetical protein [Streptomyces tropicalis]